MYHFCFDTQVMLILILIDVHCSQNAVFSFEKGSNSQNHFSSGSHHPVKILPPGWRNLPPHPLTAIWKTLEEYITQHKPLVCSFKIRKMKNIRRNFEPSRKIWKLHEDSVKGNFSSYVNKYGASSQKVASVEGYWNVLKALPEATGRSFWTDKKSR